MRRLVESSWPGNVRQLENTIHSAMALSEGPEIRPEDLDPGISEKEPAESKTSSERTQKIPLKERLRQYEKKQVEEALNNAGGVEKKAARLLGVSERSIWYLVKKHQIKKTGEA